MCNNQVNCKTGSSDFEEVFDRVMDALRNIIKDFEIRIGNKQDDSIKLHKSLVENLEKRLADLEIKEKLQWEAKHHPDPEERMPSHIFKELNAKLLKEKEEVNEALCQAKEAMPEPVNYKEMSIKFTEILGILQDPNINAEIKNMYLKDIIEKIEYDRPPNIRITPENKEQLGYEKIPRGKTFHGEPFEISITIK
jgi:hypothetical protein